MSITYNSSTYTLGQGPLFETPNATDGNGILSVMASHGPYDNFTLGSTMVDYVFTDNANLTSTCSFSIIIAGERLFYPSFFFWGGVLFFVCFSRRSFSMVQPY